jgi:hypothetical protein
MSINIYFHLLFLQDLNEWNRQIFFSNFQYTVQYLQGGSGSKFIQFEVYNLFYRVRDIRKYTFYETVKKKQRYNTDF